LNTFIGVLLGASAAVDVIMGGRSSIVGLAGFVTLPSRETVTIWQFIAVISGTGGWHSSREALDTTCMKASNEQIAVGCRTRMALQNSCDLPLPLLLMSF
jgi:hypothetical protein